MTFLGEQMCGLEDTGVVRYFIAYQKYDEA